MAQLKDLLDFSNYNYQNFFRGLSSMYIWITIPHIATLSNNSAQMLTAVNTFRADYRCIDIESSEQFVWITTSKQQENVDSLSQYGAHL